MDQKVRNLVWMCTGASGRMNILFPDQRRLPNPMQSSSRLNAEIPMSSHFDGNRPREGKGDSGERRKQEANAAM